MASQRITIRVPATLGAGLRQRSRASGKTPSDLVRVALGKYLRDGRTQSAYELAESAGLIGIVLRVPTDLSTNPRHFEGFGKNR
jgi:hypothetical protein